MKRFARILSVLLLGVSPLAYASDWGTLNADAKKHLINLINIDTSLPEPDEISAARYI